MKANISRQEIIEYCNELLQPEMFKDYAPNGLQVEGTSQVSKIVTGVTASLALIEAAIEASADMIIVHHGYFWGNEPQTIVGMKQRRIKALLENEINLVGYHLPLDAHPSLGNNVQLAGQLGIQVEGSAGKANLIQYGYFPKPLTTAEFSDLLQKRLMRPPLVVGPNNKMIEKVAWCTGGAQGYFEAAIELGVDAYISGEASEQTYHIAVENDVIYAAAGHHATERYGVQALGNQLASRFGISHTFIDIDNPI